jgi:hypothetical protein
MKTTLVALACVTAIFASSAASAKPMIKHSAPKVTHHVKHKMYHPMKRKHYIKHKIHRLEKKMGM